MSASTRFAVAIHTAGMLALTRDCPVPSEAVARSVCTNAVVVRRVIGMLARHGLVTVQKGQGGGATLARPPEQITLDEIFRAVEQGPLFRMGAAVKTHGCPVARHVAPVITEIISHAERTMLAGLHTFTLADVIRSVNERAQSEDMGQKR